MEKILNWDMDGTIADLYGVEDWMKMLDACDSTPYKVAEALVDMYELWCVLPCGKWHRRFGCSTK